MGDASSARQERLTETVRPDVSAWERTKPDRSRPAERDQSALTSRDLRRLIPRLRDGYLGVRVELAGQEMARTDVRGYPCN